MRITKRQLRRIIRESLEIILQEESPWKPVGQDDLLQRVMDAKARGSQRLPTDDPDNPNRPNMDFDLSAPDTWEKNRIGDFPDERPSQVA